MEDEYLSDVHDATAVLLLLLTDKHGVTARETITLTHKHRLETLQTQER
jgi:hypothetical protein